MTSQMSHNFFLWPVLTQKNMGSTFWERCFWLVKIDQSCYSIFFVNWASICTLYQLLNKDHSKTMLLANVVVAVQSLSHVWLFVIPWTAGSSISHYLLEFAQIHVHWIGNTIQPPQPLLLSSSFAFSLSQHQGLFQWVGFSHHVAKVLKFQLQYQSFWWLFRVDFL